MDRSFSKFDDHAIGAGISSTSLAEDYERTVDQFHELVKYGTHESSNKDVHDGTPVPEIDSQSSRDAQASLKKRGRPRKRTEDSLTVSIPHFEQAPMVRHPRAFQADFASNHRQSSRDSTQQAESPPTFAWDTLEPMALSPDEAGILQLHHTGQQNMLQTEIDLEVDMTQQYSPTPGEMHHYGIPTPQMTPPIQYSNSWIGKELPLPSSYSHYETSFVRRLIRASLEESYKLLANSGSRPEDLHRLCTFVFCFIKAPRVLQLFQEAMARTARDNLEFWTVPFYHVGDAGLHYPRVGIDATSEPPPWWANKGAMGPFPVTQPENPVPEGIVDILEYSGVSGEWFDSNDVVEYLGSKGLHLDINSSIVEITDTNEAISQGSFFDSNGMGSFANSSDLSSMATDSFYADDAFVPQDPILWSQPSSISPEGLNTFIDTDFLENTLGDESTDLAILSGRIPPLLPIPSRMKRYLDVENFIKGASPKTISTTSILTLQKALTRTTTCLGRTICFRRAAVDSALEQATTEMLDDSYYPG